MGSMAWRDQIRYVTSNPYCFYYRSTTPTLKYRNSIVTCHRTYHSYEHKTTPPFTSAETAILSAAFSHVPSLGFTTTALSQGARDAGYLDASVNLFPSGAFALVNYHLVTRRLDLADGESASRQSQNIAEEVKRLALKRLHANTSIIYRWQEVRLPILSLTYLHHPSSYLFIPRHFSAHRID